ncbi:hypothetical protein JOF41_007299 [Saccharothrix coeruleofusca]|uniref:hypothetical protein n=1 Tax=Saccharothrix coeruleofusca TaxID=33919 RepID=UPI001AE39A9B|nr:hypothetical protein [Saccharothrix coeruleofusca]MBP2341045.1 hypothetical protein [Saccharothrix coeruleofusca]
MTPDIATVRQLVFGRAAVEPIQCAYSVETTAVALGIPSARVARLIQRGLIRARQTGRRYIIAGGTILEMLDVEEHDVVRDHRTLIQPDVAYSYGDIAVMLDLSIDAVKRLAYNGRLVPDIACTRPLTSGAVLLTYLNGSDAPIRHRHSA